MAVREEKTKTGFDLIIDGFEKGIASSPYTGIANMRNVGISYYPSVAYVNYKRKAATLAETDTNWYAGTHSTNVSNNAGWTFAVPFTATMDVPVQNATSPAGLNYILDKSGQIWKQSAVNSSTYNILLGGGGRITNGAGGLAYWNNYLVVFGSGYIEFCGDGTGDAGITYNWNISSSNTTIQVTSAFRAMQTGGVPTSPVNFNFSSAPITGATSATLNASWTGATGTYQVRFDNGAADVRSVLFTNASTSVTWSGGLTNDTADTGFAMYQLDATNNTFTGYGNFVAGSIVTFSSSGTLPTGITAGTLYYLQQTIDKTGNATTFYVSTTNSTSFSNAVMLSDTGSGTITMTLYPSISPPIKNTTISGFTWNTAGIGSTAITLSSPWLQASGIYNIVDTLGNNLLATFTYLSSTVALINPSAVQPSGTFSVNILNTSATTYRTWVSKVDGNLYFANGRWVGRLQSSPNANATFNPSVPSSYTVNYAATGTLQPQDSVVDMTDLRGSLMILGNKDVYPWNYVSAQPNVSFPVGEQNTGIINILNNVYIFSGQKGNIYVSNGSAAQFLFKMPDYIAGVIDPVWTWGGYMQHRGKLFFQALAQDTSGTNLLAGIFSLNVSATLATDDTETANSFNMESQNSAGLIPASDSTGAGVLIDSSPSSSGQDSYYSAYSNGATTGIIDYNDTTLWQSNEPTIETEIIPIGTYLTKATLGSIEVKLDRPMVSGDSFSLYWRSSFSDSYTNIPFQDTSSTLLSNWGVTGINQAQWAQFKLTLSCAPSGSSRIPVREIRIHINV